MATRIGPIPGDSVYTLYPLGPGPRAQALGPGPLDTVKALSHRASSMLGMRSMPMLRAAEHAHAPRSGACAAHEHAQHAHELHRPGTGLCSTHAAGVCTLEGMPCAQYRPGPGPQGLGQANSMLGMRSMPMLRAAEHAHAPRSGACAAHEHAEHAHELHRPGPVLAQAC